MEGFVVVKNSFALLSLCAILAACGVDGEPETPEPQPVQPQPDVAASVTITDGGVYPAVGISQGWWNIYIGSGGGW